MNKPKLISAATAPARRSNVDRSADATAALMRAGRAQFIEHGFNGAATPRIAAAAGMTRGALYHHFADKIDLFRAVISQEAEAVAAAIRQGTNDTVPPADALLAGTAAYLDAMALPGRARLLLIDAPAVLGRAEVDQLDAQTGRATLREGLQLALGMDSIDDGTLDALAELLSAAFDRAALAQNDGKPTASLHAALELLLRGLLARAPQPTR